MNKAAVHGSVVKLVRMHDAEHGGPWQMNHGVVVSETVRDGRGSVQSVARGADVLEMHEVDGAHTQQKVHSVVSTEKDHVQNGKDARGGESWQVARGSRW